MHDKPQDSSRAYSPQLLASSTASPRHKMEGIARLNGTQCRTRKGGWGPATQSSPRCDPRHGRAQPPRSQSQDQTVHFQDRQFWTPRGSRHELACDEEAGWLLASVSMARQRLCARTLTELPGAGTEDPQGVVYRGMCECERVTRGQTQRCMVRLSPHPKCTHRMAIKDNGTLIALERNTCCRPPLDERERCEKGRTLTIIRGGRI